MHKYKNINSTQNELEPYKSNGTQFNIVYLHFENTISYIMLHYLLNFP